MKKLLFLMPVILSTGCFLGTFRSAEPVGAGNIERSLYFNLPLYYSKDYKNSARSLGTFYARPNLGAMVTFGASDEVDFGVKFDLSEGLGSQVKLRFLHYYPFSAAINGGFAYNFLAEGFSWNFDLLGSVRLSSYTSFYSGLLLHHAPDYRGNPASIDYSAVSDFRNFWAFALGISFRNFAFRSLFKGANMEVVFPVDRYPPFIWGFSFSF